MASNELTIRQPETTEIERFMPVMSLEQARQRREIIVEATAQLMKQGVDYGVIPGTQKNTLLAPGADKLCNLFGLTPRFTIVNQTEDWTGERFGEPFFFYNVKCRLFRGDPDNGGVVIGEGDGSCNSWESKYRWRKSERSCPNCGLENIRKSKQGGWYCWAKTDGCGANFDADDPRIVSQPAGRRPNPDIFDLVNTIMKMADKRAKTAAVLNATSAHEFFTQDTEDILVQREENEAQPPARPQKRSPDFTPPQDEADPYAANPVIKHLWAQMNTREAAHQVLDQLCRDVASASDGDPEPFWEVMRFWDLGSGDLEADIRRHPGDVSRRAAADVVQLLERLRAAKQVVEMPEPGKKGGKK